MPDAAIASTFAGNWPGATITARRFIQLPGGIWMRAMKVEHILETCLYVDDLVRAEEFYRDVLGLTFVSRQEKRQVFFRCGQRMLLLFNPLVSRDA